MLSLLDRFLSIACFTLIKRDCGSHFKDNYGLFIYGLEKFFFSFFQISDISGRLMTKRKR